MERGLGLQGLRAVHALAVAAILALAWSALRRASGSRAFASLGTGVFAVLAAYRLFQLRPHLVTLLGALLVVRFLLLCEGPLSRRRAVAVAALFALWANAHGAFVLGLALLGAAVAGALAAPLSPPWQEERHRRRGAHLAAALGLGLAATFANPTGAQPHLLYFAAGAETPALQVVADEWSALSLFALPTPGVPPSPLAWALVWALLVTTPCAVAIHLRRRGAARAEAPDPALLAAAALSLVAMLAAVRLLWLGVIPLLAAGSTGRALGLWGAGAAPRPRLAWSAAALALLLVPGFLRYGDWGVISQWIRPGRYAEPYPAGKYHAHAVWFLRDAGLEGNVWNDYGDGNFLGTWLAPRLRVFVNGSLNVPAEVMEAGFALRERRGLRPGERFTELLERRDLDLFFGSGLPVVPAPGRPTAHTTTHLERTPGWIPIFRSARSAVYLKRGARNRANLERVARYYARRGVPFHPRRGFETGRVVREAPAWALANGLVPADLQRLESAARSLDPLRRPAARERLASVYALIGLYERAVRVDRRRLRSEPGSPSAARRLLWCLLHLGRSEESLEAAERLAGLAGPGDALSKLLVNEARRHARLPEEEARARVAVLPLFARPQMGALLAGFREPEVRERCPRSGCRVSGGPDA